MRVTAYIIICAAGVLAARLINKFLPKRMPEAFAWGLAFWVMMLAFQPLRQSISPGPLSFVAWMIWITFVAIAFTIICALVLSKRLSKNEDGERGA
jgi:Co/Zn/Cd efflux system component